MWDERVDEILGSDPTAVLAFVTPASGVVVTPVSTFGLRDREAATVTFTSSLGFWRKLARIEANPRIALFFYLRDAGLSTMPGTILIQGEAAFPTRPDPAGLDELFTGPAARFIGPSKSGLVWKRITHAYYRVRVPVTVSVRSITDGTAAEPVASQPEPAKGTAPRTNLARAARRASSIGNTVVGYVGSDGFPVVVPVEVNDVRADGLVLRSSRPLPAGGRRAGLLSHHYRHDFTKQAVSYHTGWLEVRDGGVRYAPHTSASYSAPGGTRARALVFGLSARAGLASARRQGLVEGERWLSPSERRHARRDELTVTPA